MRKNLYSISRCVARYCCYKNVFKVIKMCSDENAQTAINWGLGFCVFFNALPLF